MSKYHHRRVEHHANMKKTCNTALPLPLQLASHTLTASHAILNPNSKAEAELFSPAAGTELLFSAGEEQFGFIYSTTAQTDSRKQQQISI